MASGNCEWCHRRRLMSWVTCHRKQVENVTFEVVTSGKSKFQTVEKYLNSLNKTACSTVQYNSIEGRYVTVINRDIRMYCGRFVGPSHTAHGWSPCFIRIVHARIQNWTVCYNGVHTQWPRNGAKRKAPSFLPSKSDLRSLPKRMNTWPKKNLMTMMSDVRNKTLNHVLYLVNLT